MRFFLNHLVFYPEHRLLSRFAIVGFGINHIAFFSLPVWPMAFLLSLYLFLPGEINVLPFDQIQKKNMHAVPQYFNGMA